MNVIDQNKEDTLNVFFNDNLIYLFNADQGDIKDLRSYIDFKYGSSVSNLLHVDNHLFCFFPRLYEKHPANYLYQKDIVGFMSDIESSGVCKRIRRFPFNDIRMRKFLDYIIMTGDSHIKTYVSGNPVFNGGIIIEEKQGTTIPGIMGTHRSGSSMWARIEYRHSCAKDIIEMNSGNLPHPPVPRGIKMTEEDWSIVYEIIDLIEES